MAAKKNIISREGYEKIVMEINELKEVQIPETLEVLKDARAQWDLSENSDYHAAKEKLSLLNKRIADLETMIEQVDIVDDDGNTQDSHVVKYGSLVTVFVEDDKEYTFEMVGTGEVDVDNELKLSLDSPVGLVIDGKKTGDEVIMKIFNAKKKVKILAVK